MKINIYYGGRGLVDDPTLFVIGRMQKVFEELHVSVDNYNLYELKNSITTLPQTLKGADGIILATTVEWYGIGGYMQQFLDSCWLYGDKENISRIYMCPVVMATTYGEREGKLNLSNAWEILGGLPCSGICGYITDSTMLENNPAYINIIDKKAENMYRTINQRLASLPASNQAVKQKISLTKSLDLTPQETEQLSQYASDESYVQRQKADIQELTGLFRDMMQKETDTDSTEFISEMKEHFVPQPGTKAVYCLDFGDGRPLVVETDGAKLTCGYAEGRKDADLSAKMSRETMNEIVNGRMTFQRAFMEGNMSTRGDFKVLRTLDLLFQFAV
jgi:multimeric flavodoxin WrbA